MATIEERANAKAAELLAEILQCIDLRDWEKEQVRTRLRHAYLAGVGQAQRDYVAHYTNGRY